MKKQNVGKLRLQIMEKQCAHDKMEELINELNEVLVA